jgi:hypothetical protein
MLKDIGINNSHYKDGNDINIDISNENKTVVLNDFVNFVMDDDQ